CGTGNLTIAILEFLSDEGKIVAVDFSKKMIEIAKKKIFDKRVKWFCGDIEWIQLKNSTFDRIICYSVWPHFQNHLSIVKRFYNILKKDGKIHIWHLKSKEEINEIHSKAHPL
ncbi:MAG: class I SAM-dependent methyltransferase, partial [Chitinispirillaceae bacterium]|nr:class I SAM-dependent methyltransferase [Chitinispirillaceae bacterium]